MVGIISRACKVCSDKLNFILPSRRENRSKEKWSILTLSSLVFINGELSNEVTLCPFIVDGYRFGEVKHQGKIRYFLIDPKNTIKEQYTVFYKFIFMPSNSYIEVSDNTLTYKSIDNGSNTKINSSGVLKEYWCEYEEIGGDNSNGNPIVKFNPAIGQFSVI